MKLHNGKTHRYTIPQIDGNIQNIAPDETVQTCNTKQHDVKERVKSPRYIEYLTRLGKINYDFWCYKCDEEYGSRLGFKGHVHNKHSITV